MGDNWIAVFMAAMCVLVLAGLWRVRRQSAADAAETLKAEIRKKLHDNEKQVFIATKNLYPLNDEMIKEIAGWHSLTFHRKASRNAAKYLVFQVD